jgi:hypothetical protein
MLAPNKIAAASAPPLIAVNRLRFFEQVDQHSKHVTFVVLGVHGDAGAKQKTHTLNTLCTKSGGNAFAPGFESIQFKACLGHAGGARSYN